ncbi:MAG: hypothetical protein AAF624_06595 [Bacteroidota bacterium]
MTASTFAAALAERLLDALPDDQPLGRDVLASLPVPVAHFLDGWLAQHVGRVDATLRSPWVSETPELAAVRADLVTAMQYYAQVPVERRVQVLRYATTRVVGFLVAPTEALVKTVGETGAGPYPVETVLTRLGWFAGHPTLAEVLRSYFDWKGMQHVTTADLRRLVPQIDERLAEEESLSDRIDRLIPLYDLSERLGDGRRLPMALLRDHFAARSLDLPPHAEPAAAVSEAELLTMLQGDTPSIPINPEALTVEDDDLGFASALLEAEPTEETASPASPAEPSLDSPTPEPAPMAPASVRAIEATHENPEQESVPASANPTEEESTTEEPGTSAHPTPPVPASALDAPLTELQGTSLPSTGLEAHAPDDDRPAVSDVLPADEAALDEAALDEAAQPNAAHTENAPTGPSGPATIEEATRDEQPLWSQYAAPETPSVNDRFADPDAPTAPTAEDDEEVPLWKRYFSGGDSGPTPTEDALPSETDVDVRPATMDVSAPELPRPETPATAASPPPVATEPTEQPGTEGPDPEQPDTGPALSALELRLLGDVADQRASFVDELTNGDAAAYDAALQAIDQAGSWIEASQIITQDVLRRYSVYRWNPQAVAFLNAVETYYHRSSHS